MKKPDPKDVALAYCMAFSQEVYSRRDSYQSDKGGLVHANNSYVYMLARALDADHKVKRFRHGGVRFAYYHPVLQKEMGGYFDFSVTNVDGTARLLYVTPSLKVHTPVEEAMIEGAECVARDARATFELITEAEIFGPNPDYMFSVIRYIMDKMYLKEVPEDQSSISVSSSSASASGSGG